jgi:hypothetical protein
MRQQRIDVIVVPQNTGHSTDFQSNSRYLTHCGGGGDSDIAAVFPLEGEVTAPNGRAFLTRCNPVFAPDGRIKGGARAADRPFPWSVPSARCDRKNAGRWS